MLEPICFHGMVLNYAPYIYLQEKNVGNKFSPTDKSSTFIIHIARYILVTTKVYAALFVYTVAQNSNVLISAQDFKIHNTLIQNFF
jgi:hypothetical protein